MIKISFEEKFNEKFKNNNEYVENQHRKSKSMHQLKRGIGVLNSLKNL